MKGATIALPGNGEPIASIEISGSRHPFLLRRLSLWDRNRRLAKKWLRDTQWKMAVGPDYSSIPAPPIRLSLQFIGLRQRIEIVELTITTVAQSNKEQPRELISRIPGNPYLVKDENVVWSRN